MFSITFSAQSILLTKAALYSFTLRKSKPNGVTSLSLISDKETLNALAR